MLLPEHGQSGFMSDVGLVQLHLELGKLLLTSGVESNLGGGVAARLLKLLVEFIKLPAKGAAALRLTDIEMQVKFIIGNLSLTRR